MVQANRKKLSIVVPTYNESENIGILCCEISNVLETIDYEIIFIDDSDDDITLLKIKELEKLDSRICHRHRENEKGLATAVLEGFLISKGEYIAVMDADLQHPPELLLTMYNTIQDYDADICIPSRFIAGGSDRGLNLVRKFVSGGARCLGRIMLTSLKKISDPTGGVFMFRRECISDVDLKPIGWKIMVEVLAMADYSMVVEIPYKFGQRNAGISKISLRVSLQYMKQLIELRKREKKRRDVAVIRII